jgi:hypothetical protein
MNIDRVREAGTSVKKTTFWVYGAKLSRHQPVKGIVGSVRRVGLLKSEDASTSAAPAVLDRDALGLTALSEQRKSSDEGSAMVTAVQQRFEQGIAKVLEDVDSDIASDPRLVQTYARVMADASASWSAAYRKNPETIPALNHELEDCFEQLSEGRECASMGGSRSWVGSAD